MNGKARKTKQVVKEGYLTKKGHVRHNWKTRWFILYDDRLIYTRSKQEKGIKGHVILQSASVISPCQVYTKKENVFRVLQLDGKEFLLQCCNEDELIEWTVAISEVIRSIGNAISGLKTPPMSRPAVAQTTLGSSISHRELVDAMQDVEAGLALSNHTVSGKQYKMCFCGSDLVDWLMCWAFVKSRDEGFHAGIELVQQGFIQPIEVVSNGNDLAGGFIDSSAVSYRFVTILHSSSNEFDFDFSESSTDSEDDDNSEMDYSETNIGKIVKQGFLLKQGHIRHNWKIRKFVLREGLSNLVYYKPTKDKRCKGSICLTRAQINEVDQDEVIDSSCTKPKRIESETFFKIRTRKGVLFILQAPNPTEKADWIQHLNEAIC